MKNKTIILIILLILIAVFAVSAKGAREKDTDAEKKKQASDSGGVDREGQAAIVNGSGIHLDELEEELTLISGQMAAQGQPVTEAQKDDFRRRVLDSMISRMLLLEEAESEGIEVSDEELDSQMTRIRGQFQSDEEYEDALAAQNLTPERLRKDLKDNLIIQELLKKEVEDKVTVTDDEAIAYYDNNTVQFKQPEQVKASHIIVTLEEGAGEEEKAEARAKIEDILSRLEGGKDFAELAEEVSEGPSASRGGDLGYFGRGQMVKSFEDAAFALESGELSGIVETQFGYHIIKVTDRKESSTIGYEEVKNQIKDFLIQQKQSEAFDTYLQNLKDNAEIEILLESEAS